VGKCTNAVRLLRKTEEFGIIREALFYANWRISAMYI
jgi:hypothetical protein